VSLATPLTYTKAALEVWSISSVCLVTFHGLVQQFY
jgi:hypothetical protein